MDADKHDNNVELPRYDLYIDGRARAAGSGEYFETFDPFRGAPWALIARGNAADVSEAAEAAHRAYRTGSWPSLNASERGRLLVRLGQLIETHVEELARVETRDNGKLLAEMRAQIRYLPQWFHYFGGLADKIEGSVIPIDKARTFTFTRHEPLGVIAVITPWNSPLLLAAWKLAPALAAGNTIVWKPSEHASASAVVFANLIEEAGFPPGVVNVVTGLGEEIGDALVAHPRVAKIAFTGGEAVGRQVYACAAAHLKPVLLELGGKSANIVFEDAEQDDAVKGAISGIFAASGQTCVAGSRLLIQRRIYASFVDSLVAFARGARLGDPADPATNVGPMTTRAQYLKVLDYIEAAKAEGATCLLGGGAATGTECGSGWFVEPTIFGDVTPSMRIAREEVFGPVLAIMPFDEEEHAIRIACELPYGLAAGVWTQQITRALRMSQRLEAGTVWVNTYRAISYMAPFGGYKRSGFGRENGVEAIREYMQTKSVWINAGAAAPDPFVIR